MPLIKTLVSSAVAYLLRADRMKIPRAKVPGVNMQDRAAFESAIVESVLRDVQELQERAQHTLVKSAETLKLAKATIKRLESAVPSSATA
jgi:hypothetical protein